MRKALTVSLAAALVLSACAGTETIDSEDPQDIPEAMLLGYGLTNGSSYVYEVELMQRVDMTGQGDGGGFSENEIPGEAQVDLTASGTMTYEVSDGPEPGTFTVTITGDFDDLGATGTVDGEPVESGDVPEFAQVDPISLTIVVDDQGNIVPDAPDAEDPLGGLFGGLGSLGNGSLPGTQLGQFFGPPFGDDAVTVGDSWSEKIETPGFGTEPMVTSTTSTVTGTDVVDGVDVFVIESDTTVSPVEFDLGEFMIGLFTGLASDDDSAQNQTQIDEIVENLRFLISTDESTTTSVTHFDPVDGISRQFDFVASTVVRMDINFPDQETGEMAGFVMEMDLSQTMNHRLVSGPTA